PDDKLKRYYCINQFKLSKDMKNRNSGKESYVANRYCTPIIKKEGINFKAPKVSFEIYGYMIFDMVSKNIDIEVTNIKEGDINDKKIIAFFDNLKETYDKWHLSDFKQFKTV